MKVGEPWKTIGRTANALLNRSLTHCVRDLCRLSGANLPNGSMHGFHAMGITDEEFSGQHNKHSQFTLPLPNGSAGDWRGREITAVIASGKLQFPYVLVVVTLKARMLKRRRVSVPRNIFKNIERINGEYVYGIA